MRCVARNKRHHSRAAGFQGNTVSALLFQNCSQWAGRLAQVIGGGKGKPQPKQHLYTKREGKKCGGKGILVPNVTAVDNCIILSGCA